MFSDFFAQHGSLHQFSCVSFLALIDCNKTLSLKKTSRSFKRRTCIIFSVPGSAFFLSDRSVFSLPAILLTELPPLFYNTKHLMNFCTTLQSITHISKSLGVLLLPPLFLPKDPSSNLVLVHVFLLGILQGLKGTNYMILTINVYLYLVM